MAYENLLVETRGGVGLVTLNRPKALNALSDALMDELGEALKAFDADENIGAIVLTGSEKAFAAGADIGMMAKYSYMDVYKGDYITRNWETIRSIRKPIIGAVAGFALGGGCELAMMCDIVIAADTAKFGQPEIKLGVILGAGGTQRLPRAQVKAELAQLAQAGYSAGSGDNANYPQDIQAAEAKVAAQQNMNQTNSAYGGMHSGGTASGSMQRNSYSSSKGSDNTCVGPASFCVPFFGS